MLAQMEPDVHWPLTVQAIIGLVGVLSIVWLVLSVAIACKKLFGKHPPIHEELRDLRTEFENSDLLLSTAIAAERTAREKAFADLAVERRTTLAELNKKIDDLPGKIVADMLNTKKLFL